MTFNGGLQSKIHLNPLRRRASSKSQRLVHCCCLVGDRSVQQRATAPLLYAIHRAAAAPPPLSLAGAAAGTEPLSVGATATTTAATAGAAPPLPLLGHAAARRRPSRATSRGLRASPRAAVACRPRPRVIRRRDQLAFWTPRLAGATVRGPHVAANRHPRRWSAAAGAPP
ncbi:hypothetical protein Scep_001773 [Stephania cephalantha]|uniref:Uncharacterized protein n=1 Tax=Stephania cephalantha TaxID=152367 RepID=A0AAP0Q3P2_9MAGN